MAILRTQRLAVSWSVCLIIALFLSLAIMGCGESGPPPTPVPPTPTPVPPTPTPTPVPPTPTPVPPTPTPTPTPPPFERNTLRISAGDTRPMSYSISEREFSESQGKGCFEYEVDLIQESSSNHLDLRTHIVIPTGEEMREVIIDAMNSPIRGKVRIDQAGRYAIVLDNSYSLFTSKTVDIKTRAYWPCS